MFAHEKNNNEIEQALPIELLQFIFSFLNSDLFSLSLVSKMWSKIVNELIYSYCRTYLKAFEENQLEIMNEINKYLLPLPQKIHLKNLIQLGNGQLMRSFCSMHDIYPNYEIDDKTLMMYAASLGQIEIMEVLKERGASLNLTINNKTARDYALENNHTHAVQWLSANTSELLEDSFMFASFTQQYYQTTPFHIAAEAGHLQKIILLLQENPGLLNARNEQGASALMIAAMRRETKIVLHLLQNKADMHIALIEDVRCEGLIFVKNADTFLHILIKLEQTKMIEAILQMDWQTLHSDVTKTKDEFVNQLLHIACLLRHQPLIKFLREKGGNFFAQMVEGDMPVLALIRREKDKRTITPEEFSDLVPMNKFYLTILVNWENLKFLVQEDREDILQNIIEAHNQKAPTWPTDRIISNLEDREDILQNIIEAHNQKAPTWPTDKIISNLFEEAVQGNRYNCIKLLLPYIDLSLPLASLQNLTPFEKAVAENNENLIQLLAVPSFFSFAERGLVDKISLTLEHDVPINSRDKNGATGLYLAAKHLREEAVTFLLTKKADCSIPTYPEYYSFEYNGRLFRLPNHVAETPLQMLKKKKIYSTTHRQIKERIIVTLEQAENTLAKSSPSITVGSLSEAPELPLDSLRIIFRLLTKPEIYQFALVSESWWFVFKNEMQSYIAALQKAITESKPYIINPLMKHLLSLKHFILAGDSDLLFLPDPDANVDVQLENNMTLLMFAASLGRQGIVKFLLGQGAKANVMLNGKTALHYALENNHWQAANLLVSSVTCSLITDETLSLKAELLACFKKYNLEYSRFLFWKNKEATNLLEAVKCIIQVVFEQKDPLSLDRYYEVIEKKPHLRRIVDKLVPNYGIVQSALRM